jgi:ATP-dependent Clp protease ATP-binding subunit ClpX
MLDVMYDLPGRDNVRECIISEEVVARKQDPILVYESDAEWA